jgi:hypothetical protein
MRVDLVRVDKREFARKISQLSYPVQTRTRVTVHESWWELTSESLHERFINSHAPVKRDQELHESWKVRVCMRVFSTFVSRSNENKSYMRVEKWEFAWEFSQLSCPVQTRTRVTWELMRVEKREFAWEFSQLSCPVQTRSRVPWELRSGSLHESFLNSHAPAKREQESRESWWEQTGYYHARSENSHSNLNRSKVDESRWQSVKREHIR